jgi:hypothetical protein
VLSNTILLLPTINGLCEYNPSASVVADILPVIPVGIETPARIVLAVLEFKLVISSSSEILTIAISYPTE